MRSVLGSVGSRRRLTTSTALLNASAFGLRGYVDTLSPLVAMLLLDRSCVIVGSFLNYYVPQQWHQSQVYEYMLYAQVEHNELWVIIVILLTSMSYFDSVVLLVEASQTDIT